MSEDWQERKERRELAYRLWRDCGQNLREAHRQLTGDEFGHSASYKSMKKWKKKYEWEARAARVEAEEKRIADGSSDDGLLSALISQKNRYINYFDSLPAGKVDNQANYALVGLINGIQDLRERQRKAETPDIDLPRLFLSHLDFIAETLKDKDPDGVVILLKHFDDLTEAYKRHHETATPADRRKI